MNKFLTALVAGASAGASSFAMRGLSSPLRRMTTCSRGTGWPLDRLMPLPLPMGEVPATLHARLGYDERYKAESGWVKEQPAAAPQAAPATPPL
jgi:hypothetical protein